MAADPSASLTASRAIIETQFFTNVSNNPLLSPFIAAIPSIRNKTSFTKKLKEIGSQFVGSSFSDPDAIQVIAPHLDRLHIIILHEAPTVFVPTTAISDGPNLVAEATAMLHSFFRRSGYDVYAVTCATQTGEFLEATDQLTCTRIVSVTVTTQSILPVEFVMPLSAIHKYALITHPLFLNLRLHVVPLLPVAPGAGIPSQPTLATSTSLATAPGAPTPVSNDDLARSVNALTGAMASFVQHSTAGPRTSAPANPTAAQQLVKRQCEQTSAFYTSRNEFLAHLTIGVAPDTVDPPATAYVPGDAAHRAAALLLNPLSDTSRPVITSECAKLFLLLQLGPSCSLMLLKRKNVVVTLDTVPSLLSELKVLLVKMGPRFLSHIDTLIANYISFLSKYRSILVVLAVVQLFDSFFASLRDIPSSIIDPLDVDLFVHRKFSMDPAINPSVQEYIEAARDAATTKLTTDLAALSAKRDRASAGAGRDSKRIKSPNLRTTVTLKPAVNPTAKTIDWASAPELGTPPARCYTMCVDFALKKRICNHPGLCTKIPPTVKGRARAAQQPKLHAWPNGTTAQQKTDYTTWGAAQPGLQ